MVKKFDSFMNWLASTSSYVGAIGIFIIMFVICWDVGNRIFLNNPIIGTPEIAQNSLAAVAFLMLPWSTHLGQHVRSTMIKSKMPLKGAYILELIAYALGALLFIGIAISAWEPMLFATKIKDFQGEGFRVPIYPVWWVIVYGSALSFYQCVSRLVKVARFLTGKEVDVEDDKGGIQL